MAGLLFPCVANSARSQMAEGLARRLHRPLPDPAGGSASDAEKLDRFRAVRDEIARRLETLDGLLCDAQADEPAES